MILPGKHMKQDRALISVGADILAVMAEAATVSDIWQRVQAMRSTRENASPLSFDWFMLALTFLFAINAIDLTEDGALSVRHAS